ncbi:hypothetical protein D3C78_1592390 [compost metagenome]
MSANSVAPPTGVTSWAESRETLAGIFLKELSVFHSLLLKLIRRLMSPASSSLPDSSRLEISESWAWSSRRGRWAL